MDGKHIREFYANATAWSFDGDAGPHIVAARERQAAEFDRWLARVKSEAWDEAVASAYLHEDKYRISIEHDPNPYRNGEDQ